VIDPGRDYGAGLCGLFLAVPRRVHETLFSEQFGQLIVTKLQLRLLVFDEKREAIVQWIG
jgi:hypothetical protein